MGGCAMGIFLNLVLGGWTLFRLIINLFLIKSTHQVVKFLFISRFIQQYLDLTWYIDHKGVAHEIIKMFRAPLPPPPPNKRGKY